MKKITQFFEYKVFGVCTELGDKMGIPTFYIRSFFIYTSFLTFGSPLIIYLGLAFLMNMRKYFRRRHSIWNF